MAVPVPKQVITPAATPSKLAALARKFLGMISRIKEKGFKFKSFKQKSLWLLANFR
jgi:hypothetical protein